MIAATDACQVTKSPNSALHHRHPSTPAVMSHSTQPLLSGTIEADEETPPVLSGNIGSAPTTSTPAREPVVLVPGTTARDVEEGGIVSAADYLM